MDLEKFAASPKKKMSKLTAPSSDQMIEEITENFKILLGKERLNTRIKGPVEHEQKCYKRENFLC
jgi:hypothetical protein